MNQGRTPKFKYIENLFKYKYKYIIYVYLCIDICISDICKIIYMYRSLGPSVTPMLRIWNIIRSSFPNFYSNKID